ncbi:hypothetical protein DPMN_090289 [Dreissena polymorpha]|uniref:Peptidase S1 domain-containing protein n=1 Tax=Dreissena polymorpha TaxID=45954 RepID=A0A9D4KYD1_DREPO|nr:hypothetical protein DPMN_090289 [Dreissena polymorpha]
MDLFKHRNRPVNKCGDDAAQASIWYNRQFVAWKQRDRGAMLSFVLIISSIVIINGQSVPCGVPVVPPSLINKRIVGGSAAVQGSWPWMVMIADDASIISGAGSILGPRVIMTSAQVFKGDGFDYRAETDITQWALYTGSHSISSTATNEQNFTIKSIMIHENYNTTSLANDIALIITDKDIVYNDHTRPICLPAKGHTYHVGDTCYVAAWGDTTNINDEVLFQAPMPILGDQACQTRYPDYIVGTELCAGYIDGRKDFCDDDIGAPLVCKDDQSGVWSAIGIASSGGNCRTGHSPGIYEDVSKYTAWVRTTMENAGFPYAY